MTVFLICLLDVNKWRPSYRTGYKAEKIKIFNCLGREKIAWDRFGFMLNKDGGEMGYVVLKIAPVRNLFFFIYIYFFLDKLPKWSMWFYNI